MLCLTGLHCSLCSHPMRSSTQCSCGYLYKQECNARGPAACLQTQECVKPDAQLGCMHCLLAPSFRWGPLIHMLQTQECDNLMRVVRELADSRAKVVSAKASLQEKYIELQTEYHRSIRIAELSRTVSKENLAKTSRTQKALRQVGKGCEIVHMVEVACVCCFSVCPWKKPGRDIQNTERRCNRCTFHTGKSCACLCRGRRQQGCFCACASCSQGQ